jgi:hypothetical protein
MSSLTVSKETKSKPTVVATTVSPTTPSSSIEANPTLDYLDSYMEVRENKYKYPSLQKRGLIYANNLPDNVVNQIIEVLEKTGWSASEFNRLTIESYFFMGRVGLFSFFNDAKSKNVFNSDKMEDLIWLRDSLKRIVPEIMVKTGQIVQTFKKSNSDEKHK